MNSPKMLEPYAATYLFSILQGVRFPPPPTQASRKACLRCTQAQVYTSGYRRHSLKPHWNRCRPFTTSKEHSCRRLNRHQLVSEVACLAFEFLLESLLSLSISFGPGTVVVFDLFGDQSIKDNGDLVSCGDNACFRAQFGFHAAQQVAQWGSTSV